VLKAIKF